MLLSMSSGHSPGDFCSGLCSCGDLFSETDNELSMQHAYPVHQEISDEILPMHYGRTFTRERKKRVKPAQLSSIRDLTQLNVHEFVVTSERPMVVEQTFRILLLVLSNRFSRTCRKLLENICRAHQTESTQLILLRQPEERCLDVGLGLV